MRFVRPAVWRSHLVSQFEFEVTPPYMHWLSGYAEVYMRVMKIATRVRLLQMIGKFLGDVRITDSTDMWPFAMEQHSARKTWGRRRHIGIVPPPGVRVSQLCPKWRLAVHVGAHGGKCQRERSGR